MSKKILYLECNAGISPDMTVASLIDLGADTGRLKKVLSSLPVEGFTVRIEKVQKKGLEASRFCIDPENGENHSSGEQPKINDIYKMIESMESTKRARNLAGKMFSIAAEEEAAAQGLPKEQLRFGENGAVDMILELISAAVCMDDLGIEETVVSSFGGWTGEKMTSAGKAVTAALKTREALPAGLKITATGTGAGKKELQRTDFLRAMLFEEEQKIWVLETNLDDCTGEALGYVLEKLMEAGANDAYYIPVFMKKNRPAYLLSVMTAEGRIKELEDIIFKHTTTIGIRRYPVERTVLEREIRRVQTPLGEARVKQCRRQGRVEYYPEFESVKEICEDTGKGFQEVYYEIKQAAQDDLCF